MTKIHFALWFALCPALLLAQTPTKESPRPERITKVVRVRYGSATALAALAGNGAPVSITGDNILRAIVINGEPKAVAEAERTIRELDTSTSAAPSSKDIELTIYVVQGSDKAGSASFPEKLATVAPVVKQLRSIFPYKNYELLSTMLLRAGGNTGAETYGIMTGLQDTPPEISAQPSTYHIRYDTSRVSSDEAPPVIHLSKFRFIAKVAVAVGSGHGDNGKYTSAQWQMNDVGIQTDVDLKEGQKVV